MAITSQLPAGAFPIKSQLFQRTSTSAVDWSLVGADGQAYHAFYVNGAWFGWESASTIR